MTWALVAFALLAGFGLGLAGGAFAVVALKPKPPVNPWDHVPDVTDPEEQREERRATWDLRISPERYLARFPEGPHAEEARSITEG